MPEPNGGLGLVGIDDETQARMAEALRVAAIRSEGARRGGSIGGISPQEAKVSELRMLNSARQQQMQDYFQYSPVGQLERAGFEALAQASGGQAISKMAGVVPSLLGRAVPRGVATQAGQLNKVATKASETFYYPAGRVVGEGGKNYAMKGIGSPTGMGAGMLDDALGPVGSLLDVNKLRYSISNPGMYAAPLMRSQAYEMTGRK